MQNPQINPYPALWNPTISSVLSLIFSPALGSMLQKRNWLEIGNESEAQKSHYWFNGTIVFLLVYLFAEPWLPNSSFESFYFLICWVIFYAFWFFLSARKQIQFVRQQYGKDYHGKPWAKPISLGVVGLLLWMGLSLCYIFGLILGGYLKLEP